MKKLDWKPIRLPLATAPLYADASAPLRHQAFRAFSSTAYESATLTISLAYSDSEKWKWEVCRSFCFDERNPRKTASGAAVGPVAAKREALAALFWMRRQP